MLRPLQPGGHQWIAEEEKKNVDKQLLAQARSIQNRQQDIACDASIRVSRFVNCLARVCLHGLVRPDPTPKHSTFVFFLAPHLGAARRLQRLGPRKVGWTLATSRWRLAKSESERTLRTLPRRRATRRHCRACPRLYRSRRKEKRNKSKPVSC